MMSILDTFDTLIAPHFGMKRTAPVQDDFIITRSGRKFFYADPESFEYTIEDIAASLSKQCRFTGHSTAFYSTAQHSVLVSRCVPLRYALAGLLHDGAEVFMNDMNTILKRLLPEYRKIEKRIQAAIYRHFGIDPDDQEMQRFVKEADLIALATEKRDLMVECEQWSILENIMPLAATLLPETPETARRRFMHEYEFIKTATAREAV